MTKLETYKVDWTIEVDANSPTEAAQEAREIQLDLHSTATVFEVSLKHTTESIDLEIPKSTYCD